MEPKTPRVTVDADGHAELLTEMDAFELRYQLVHGLHPSDGLVIHVVSATSLMVVGTDSTPHPKHGIYMATGRHLLLLRDSQSWSLKRGDVLGLRRARRRLAAVPDLDNDLAWVRQRSDT